MTGKRHRRLSEPERALWKEVTRSVAPLQPRPAEPDLELPAAAPAPAAKRAKAAHPAVAAAKPGKPGSAPPLAPIDRRVRQRLARGTLEIDGRLDLHGFTQGQAHTALMRFLARAQADGAKFVLVITGKGGRGEGDGGVLRRQVPMWLKLPEFRSLVVGFEVARTGHGGEGALYVRLRRGSR